MNPYIEAARPKTLFNAIAPVIVGLGVGYASALRHGMNTPGATWNGIAGDLVSIMIYGALALLVALSATVAVNYANDLFDGIAGNDSQARTGPRRAVASGLISPAKMKTALALALLVFIGSGLGLIMYAKAWALLPVGILCALLLYSYSGGPYPLASHGLGEVAVFLTFGCAATMGTAYGISGLPWEAFPYALGIGGFSCAVLEANNIRDIPEDTASRKRTVAVRLGDLKARRLFLALISLPYMVSIWQVLSWIYRFNNTPTPWVWLIGLSAFISFPIANKGINRIRNKAQGQDLIPVLASTGLAMTLWAFFMAISLVIVEYTYAIAVNN